MVNSNRTGTEELRLFHKHGSVKEQYDYDKLKAGDWLKLVGAGYDRDCCRYPAGPVVIVKVISCRVTSEFWSGTPGEFTVEFPNGETEKLDNRARFGKVSTLWKYFKKDQFYDRTYDFVDIYTFRFTDRVVLRECLKQYHEQIEQQKLEARRREGEKRRAEQERRRKEEELRRRNASVSDHELDALFRGK